MRKEAIEKRRHKVNDSQYGTQQLHERITIMNIHQITFSPTGGTRRVSELLCKGFDTESCITELCTKQENLKYPSINADDFVVISMPVYAGRVPAHAV